MKKFEFLGEALCLDFLNTLHDAEAEDPEEELSSDADLAAWVTQAGILSVSEGDRLQAGALRNYVHLKLPGKKRSSLLEDARALREALRQMFRRAARAGKVAPRDVETLNLLLKRFPAAGQIEKSNGDWTMNWESQAGGAEKIFYAIVKSAAELVASGRWRAVRECASDTCTLDVPRHQQEPFPALVRNGALRQSRQGPALPRPLATRPSAQGDPSVRRHQLLKCEKAAISGRPLSSFELFSCEVVYAPFTFSACQPFGPLTTSNCTC